MVCAALLPILLPLLLFAAPIPVHALEPAEVAAQTSVRSMEQIAAAWDRLVLSHAGGDAGRGGIYEQAPSIRVPYAPGSLSQAFLDEGLGMLNFARWLAGLPGDVTLDRTLAAQQQATAVVNAATGVLTHAPARPAGMPDEMYQLAVKGAGSSNLSAGFDTLGAAMRAFLSDSDAANIAMLGHRRWVLNPAMRTTMYGHARSATGLAHIAMQAFDASRPKTEYAGYGHVAWPVAGHFPTELFRASDAWSVSPDPDTYDRKRTAEIRVVLTRARDGRTWSLGPGGAAASDGVFRVETSGYGVPFCIIFRPDDLGGLTDGDSFSVLVTGLYARDGSPREIRYDTDFFRLSDVVRPAALLLPMWPGETLGLRVSLFSRGLSDNPVRYASYSNPEVATVTPDGQVTAHRQGHAFLQAIPLAGEASFIQVTVRSRIPTDTISDWAAEGYGLARVNGLTGGLDALYQRPVSRAEFAALAVNLCERLLGRELPQAASPFSDSADPVVAKAWRSGLVKGTSATTYAPNRTIARQEAAVLLMNVHRFLLSQPETTARPVVRDLSPAAVSGATGVALYGVPFADAAAISTWAREDVARAAALGLLRGVAGNRFDPLGQLTREQTFLILQRQYEMFEAR